MTTKKNNKITQNKTKKYNQKSNYKFNKTDLTSQNISQYTKKLNTIWITRENNIIYTTFF